MGAPPISSTRFSAGQSELPIQQPVKFDLVFNQTTAKALGLEIPSRLLFTADQVIE